jgi:hypothetical protein
LAKKRLGKDLYWEFRDTSGYSPERLEWVYSVEKVRETFNEALIGAHARIAFQ